MSEDSKVRLSAPFDVPDAAEEHGRRQYPALLRITERHAHGEARARWEEQRMPLGPVDAWRRVVMLAGGGAVPEEGAAPVDADDLAAALTLVQWARAEVDEWELGLLEMARGRGLTWQQIAVNLGLGSAQAARQRHKRLTERAPAQSAD
ncbi:DNA-binding protein [Kitasatospora sp. NPDC002040]|uniref:DNA-binding protein n=1 Tax=Kitasatospora sp. NPDC002040 TaxID=3154661 RepID=UPI0033284F16